MISSPRTDIICERTCDNDHNWPGAKTDWGFLEKRMASVSDARSVSTSNRTEPDLEGAREKGVNAQYQPQLAFSPYS